MSRLIPMFVTKPLLKIWFIFLLALTFAVFVQASDDIALDVALEAAQAQVPGKVVGHDKANESVGKKGAKTLQPVYRVKIFSQQGVMKTVFVHRQTGKVVK